MTVALMLIILSVIKVTKHSMVDLKKMRVKAILEGQNIKYLFYIKVSRQWCSLFGTAIAFLFSVLDISSVKRYSTHCAG
jgi:hypothetical protein